MEASSWSHKLRYLWYNVKVTQKHKKKRENIDAK